MNEITLNHVPILTGFSNLDAPVVELVVLLRRPFQFAEGLAEGLYLVPVGKIDIGVKVRRPFGHPHDKANHGSIPEAVLGVVNSTPKNTDDGRLPGDRFEELFDVGVGVGLFFLRLARDRVDRKEGAQL